jgi:hypothetical protein
MHWADRTSGADEAPPHKASRHIRSAAATIGCAARPVRRTHCGLATASHRQASAPIERLTRRSVRPSFHQSTSAGSVASALVPRTSIRRVRRQSASRRRRRHRNSAGSTGRWCRRHRPAQQYDGPVAACCSIGRYRSGHGSDQEGLCMRLVPRKPEPNFRIGTSLPEGALPKQTQFGPVHRCADGLAFLSPA